MDNIKKHPSATPFAVHYAYDAEADKGYNIVEDGRILVDGKLIKVEGISFIDAADVYLIAEQGMNNPYLSLVDNAPENGFSKKILSVDNGNETWRDTTSLCVGCPEYVNKTKTEVISSASRSISIPLATHRHTEACSARDAGNCQWCQENNVDFNEKGSLIQELISNLKAKVKTISKNTGTQVDLTGL